MAHNPFIWRTAADKPEITETMTTTGQKRPVTTAMNPSATPTSADSFPRADQGTGQGVTGVRAWPRGGTVEASKPGEP
jgi:hypothetical protein